MADWISLVEAAYGLGDTQGAWLERLVERAVPLLDEGGGVTAQIVRNAPDDFAIEDIAVSAPPEVMNYVRQSIASASPDSIDLVYRSGITAATMSEVVFSRVPGSAEAFAQATQGTVRDALGIVAYTGIGKVVALNAPLASPRIMTSRERRRWTLAAAHVGAGLRLLHAFGNADLDSDSTEAILTPDGHVCDARGPAAENSALSRLRRAVVLLDKARGRLRRESPDEALSLWEALVHGRWSLLDHFDSDGRRFVVAVENAPDTGDPRGLTRHELRIVDLVGLGRPAKEIGYVLGVSESAVNNAISRVKAKLGLRSRSEVAAFFAPGGLRTQLAKIDVAEQSLVVGSYGPLDGERLGSLTDAERDVALLLLQGATNRAIAARRRTSENTVANQIKAVFAKLGVGNRVELAAVLTSG